MNDTEVRNVTSLALPDLDTQRPLDPVHVSLANCAQQLVRFHQPSDTLSPLLQIRAVAHYVWRRIRRKQLGVVEQVSSGCGWPGRLVIEVEPCVRFVQLQFLHFAKFRMPLVGRLGTLVRPQPCGSNTGPPRIFILTVAIELPEVHEVWVKIRVSTLSKARRKKKIT